jgi:uncharacterized membrane protein
MWKFHLKPRRGLVVRPHLVFLISSILIGVLTVAINPPLRGPDESAHFLRGLGIARGDLVPRHTDSRGRRGLFLPSELHRQFTHFDAAREALPPGRSSYIDVFRAHWRAHSTAAQSSPPVFVPYEGSEGYSPVPYLPYAAAAVLAEPFELEFLGLLYVMRIAGLLTTSVIIAFAIALSPSLKWMFFCTAMLPTALYQRAVISADGAVLAATLMVLALCLRAIDKPGESVWHRAVWVTISSLTKPPQLAFSLLETMRLSRTGSRAQWLTALLVIVPGLVLSILWIVTVSADIGAWRISEGSGLPPQEFDPVWKLQFLLDHPREFISAAITSLDYTGELWRQLIGVFGWLDVRMRSWVYPIISLLLMLTFFDTLGFGRTTRWKVACIAAFTALCYLLAVFVTFFITLTPTTADRIHGLQGRYIIVILPLLALSVSAVVNRGLGRASAPVAMASALISAAAIMDALWRAHWSA